MKKIELTPEQQQVFTRYWAALDNAHQLTQSAKQHLQDIALAIGGEGAVIGREDNGQCWLGLPEPDDE